MKKLFYLISVVTLFLTTSLLAQITNSQCFACHSNQTLQKTITIAGGTEIVPLYVNETLYNVNTHGTLLCVQCHTDLNSANLFTHASGGENALSKTFGSWARFSKNDTTLNTDGSPRTRNYYTSASMSCNQVGCHPQYAGYNTTDHFAIFKMKAARVHIVNGENVGEDYDKGCSRCHSTCATCHFESTLKQKYEGDVLAIWDSLHTYGEGPFPNAGSMTEWSMDWTTNIESHSFRTGAQMKENNNVCRSCHVGYYRTPTSGFITEEPPYTKAKATNIKRHPQFYETLLSPTHQSLKCADCHSDVHSYPGRKFDWQVEGDVICQDCHNMTDHFPQHTTVDCISCHATGFGRSAGLGNDVHDVFRWTENGRVRPLAVKYNEGLSWYPHQIEKPDPITSCAAKCHYEGNLVGATVTGIQLDNEIPIEFSLAQNYPNPFNPTTQIRYSIPKTAQVSLVVYDGLGKEIKTLFNGEQQAGNYQVAFSGENLSSGIYFANIKSEGFIKTIKMLLIR